MTEPIKKSDQLRKAILQVEAEERIIAALELHGVSIPEGTTMLDAFNTISKLLEGLAPAK